MTINAQALKTARNRQALSQEQLAELAGVSKKTIARIESGRPRAHADTIKRISKALNVDPATLAKEPNRERIEQDFPELEHRWIGAYVGGEAALAFQLIESRYLLPPKLQVRMAPLLISLLAEASLRWRREKLEALKKAHNEVWFFGQVDDPVANIINEEEDSISNGDAMGLLLPEQDPHMDPFLEYLFDLKTKVGEGDIELLDTTDPDNYYQYRLSDQTLERWSHGDRLIELALRRGHLTLSQTSSLRDFLPGGSFTALSPAERAERIRSQIPPEIRAKLEAELAAEEEAARQNSARDAQEQDHG